MAARIPETRDVFLPNFLSGPSWLVPPMPGTQEVGWAVCVVLALSKGPRNVVWECSPPLCSHTGLTPPPSWAIMPDKAWKLFEATGEIPPGLKQQPYTLCCALNGNPEKTKQFPVLSNPEVFSAFYKCTNRSVHLCGAARMRGTPKLCVTANTNIPALWCHHETTTAHSKSKLRGNFWGSHNHCADEMQTGDPGTPPSSSKPTRWGTEG